MVYIPGNILDGLTTWQSFIGGTVNGTNQKWVKPQGASFIYIYGVGAGGGGGGGATRTSGTAGNGGGGGSAGSTFSFIIPAGLVQDSLMLQIPDGGAGGIASTGGAGGNGTAGGTIQILRIFEGDTIQQVNPGNGGSSGPNGASAGSSFLNIISNCLISMCLYANVTGNAGTNGGTAGAAGANFVFSTGTPMFGGGCGGAGCTTTATTFNGGGYPAFGHYPAIPGGIGAGAVNGATGTRGRSMSITPSFLRTPQYFFGGTGGGNNPSTGVGGNGGDGDIGCGGGGGGAGVTGGAGGKGGPGFVLIGTF